MSVLSFEAKAYAVLYVTELAGMLLVWMGYRMSLRPVQVSGIA